jgi:hypothetical protein
MKIVIVVYHRFELWQAPPWFSGRLRKDFPGVEVVQRNEYGGMDRRSSAPRASCAGFIHRPLPFTPS